MAVEPVNIRLVENPVNAALLPASIEFVGPSTEAAQGTFGTPSESNRFVTDNDPRMQVNDYFLTFFNSNLRAFLFSGV